MNKILIIRFSSIGDIVLTTPVIRCIKKQLPDAVIHYLTKEKFRAVLEQNPYIDEIFTINKEIDEVMLELIRERYDFIVDLHNNIRSWRVKMVLKSPSKAFNKLNLQKWLKVNFKINLLPDLHIVDRYLEAAKPLGIQNDGKGLDFFLDPDKSDTRLSLPERFQDGYVAIVIGGQHKTKMYPADQLIELCKNLNDHVVLLGGPDDSENGTFIAKEAGDHVLNTCGNYSLMESAWLLAGASHIVTNDTGLMHIAAALRKDITSIWGNTIPEFGMYPYFPKECKAINNMMEVKPLSCRPCSKIGFKKCPKGHFKCMKNIKPQVILESIQSH
ncbi:MAG: glycosyltransferase family 9 protein [Bacteroidota bacterium]|nr:glycosyltransferase family 9 protein [Bacteroidota bacterium]